MRVLSLRPRMARAVRLLTFLGSIALVVPAQSAVAGSAVSVSRTQLVAPSTVTLGHKADLRGLLTIAGRPVAGRDLVFVARWAPDADWRTLGISRTDMDGWAALRVDSVDAPTQYGVYYAGTRGVLASRTATAYVHVVDLVAAAPHHVRAGHPARIGGRLLLDGEGVSSEPVHFMFRKSAQHKWHAARWDMGNAAGWARVQRRFHHTYQVGVRFEGSEGLAPSPLVIRTVHVRRPPAPEVPKSGFVFPFLNPSIAMSPSSWTQDQGIDLAATGYRCGSAAVLVAVGNGVVIQKGISGFGSTAPVLRMTSGPFAGRNVYYGHTGRVFVHVGETVHAGQKLGEIGCGSVGYSSAPHLEIGVGLRGGPPCCPPMHATSAEMLEQLTAALRS